MKISLAQLECVQENPAHNLRRAIQVLDNAHNNQCDLIVFPEMFLTGFIFSSRLQEYASPLDSPNIQQLCTLAEEHGLGIVIGFPELDTQTKQVYNSAIAIESNGKIAGVHRKVHLFDRESSIHTAGTELEPFQFCKRKIGLLICFDTEFPESARLLAQKGAEMILAPTANMTPYETFQRVYVRARALENHIFFGICNRVGSDTNYTYFGESAIADPFGNFLCRAGRSEEVVTAELDFTLITKSKQVYDYLAQRRPDVYQFTK